MMPSPMVDRAEEIQVEILELLDAADLENVRVTIDPREIAKSLEHGVVVVTPPRLDFTTYSQTEGTWEIWVIAGPAQNIHAAWSRVDQITHVLGKGLEDVSGADPEGYTPGPNQPPVPAYVLKITETYIET